MLQQTLGAALDFINICMYIWVGVWEVPMHVCEVAQRIANEVERQQGALVEERKVRLIVGMQRCRPLHQAP